MFTLKWKKGNSPNREALGQDITELATDAHGTAYADWGIFCLDIEARMAYKDGTQQYRVFLYTKEAVSCVQIPLLSIRGYLADAIKATEELLFSQQYDFPANTFQGDQPCKETTLDTGIRVHQIAVDYAQNGEWEPRILLDDPQNPQYDSKSAPCALMDVESCDDICEESLNTYCYEDTEIPESIIQRILHSKGTQSDHPCNNAKANARPIDGMTYRIKVHGSDCRGMLVEVSGTKYYNEAEDALARFCANLAMDGYIITSVTEVHTADNATPKVSVLTSKAYKDELKRLRNGGAV